MFCRKLHGMNVFEKMFTVYPGNRTHSQKGYTITIHIQDTPIHLIWQYIKKRWLIRSKENDRNKSSLNFSRNSIRCSRNSCIKTSIEMIQVKTQIEPEKRMNKQRKKSVYLLLAFIESVRFSVSKRRNNRLSISSFFFSRVKRWRIVKFYIRLRKKKNEKRMSNVKSNGGDR